MSGKTFNQVEIKPEMISCHLLLYFTQDHQGLASYTTKVLFPTPSKVHSHHGGLFILPQVMEHCIDNGKYIRHNNNAKFLNEGNQMH